MGTGRRRRDLFWRGKLQSVGIPVVSTRFLLLLAPRLLKWRMLRHSWQFPSRLMLICDARATSDAEHRGGAHTQILRYLRVFNSSTLRRPMGFALFHPSLPTKAELHHTQKEVRLIT